MRYFKWNYSWAQMRAYYIQKNKEQAERTSAFCKFLVELTSAALGGKSSEDGEVGLDSGEGLDELTDEQIQNLKTALGEKDFANLYPDYV